MLGGEIIKRAREIKITAPYYETLNETVNYKEKLDEGKIFELFKIIDNLQGKFYGNYKLEIKPSIHIIKSQIGEFLEKFDMHIFPLGEFDNKAKSEYPYVKKQTLTSFYLIWQVTEVLAKVLLMLSGRK